MAFKSIEIRHTLNMDNPSVGVFNPVYCGKPQFTSGHQLSELKIRTLPRSKGFSFNMEPPYVNFKTLRSMLNGGCGDIARRVIATKTRSWITPDYIYDNLLNYCYPTKNRVTGPVYDQVLSELSHQFTTPTPLKPLSFKEAARTIPQNTSPGIPWIHLAPGCKKGDILDHHIDNFDDYWRETGSRKFLPLPDCAAFARSHIGSPGTNKVRPVWAYPLTVVAAEAMFATPIIEALKAQTIGRNTAYGMEMMKGGMEWLNQQCLRAKHIDPGAKFLLTDYTSFDSSVPAWLIRDCFKVIWGMFDFGDQQSYYYNVFRRLVGYFINTPIRTPDGRRLLTNHGIPSGSMFTNIIGTMVNFVLSRYTTKALTNSDPLFDVYFGDDAFICLRSTSIINMDDIAHCLKELFGIKMSLKKSYWTNKVDNVHFLGYYNNCGTPFKPSEELFASMLYPQYNKDEWSYTMARALGCLMASAGNNYDVYMAVLSVYNRAEKHEGALDTALNLIQSNARMKRHLINMGIEPGEISYRYLHDYRLTVPRSTCSKLVHNIIL